MPKTPIKLVPGDHGRRMSLEDFEHAESEHGRMFELSRGVVTFRDVPDLKHLRQVVALRKHVYAYDLVNPGRLRAILSGAECKLLADEFESERHPDLAIYLTREPERDDSSIWREWIPEIVVEIVSFGSEWRDYVEKSEEYLAIGVREYWIFDANKQEMHVLRRWGGQRREKVLKPGDTYTTRLLPGFELPVSDVLEAA